MAIDLRETSPYDSAHADPIPMEEDPMRGTSMAWTAFVAFAAAAAAAPAARAGAVTEPVAQAETASAAPSSGGGHVLNATGGYHFTIPPHWNGDIFGNNLPVENRLTFNARKDADGTVSGWYDYEQTFEGDVFKFSGPVTCLGVYDTPVLVGFPEVPALTQNRAKWGGRVDRSTDPTIPV